MERDRSTRVAIAAFAVLAVILVVALSGERRREPASGSGLLGSGPGQFVARHLPAWVVGLFLLVLLLAGIAAFLALDREEQLLVAGFVVAIVAAAVYIYLFWDPSRLPLPQNQTNNSSPVTSVPGPGETVSPGGGEGDGEQSGTALPSRSVWVLLVLAVGVVAILALRVGADEEDDAAATAATDDEEEELTEPTADEVALAAGRAADHLEGDSGGDGTFENDVYRAWHEMTTLLDLERPGTSTPGEFARAAIGAGLDAGAVRTITRLFEEVRYGDRAAAERERAAVDALRSIETAHEEPAEVSDELPDQVRNEAASDGPDAGPTDGHGDAAGHRSDGEAADGDEGERH